MKIAIAQMNTRAADFEPTARRMAALSRSAADQGADLLVFPLAALCGPLPADYANHEGYLLDLSDTLVALSDTVACPCIVPVVTNMDGEPFAEAMMVSDGELTPLRLTSRLPDSPRLGAALAGSLGEGHDVAGFELGGLRFALAFTYDDINATIDAGSAIDVLLYVPVYSYALDDAGSVLGSALAENRFRGDARALDAWMVACGSLGGYGTQVFTGSSFVIAPDGELVACAPAFEEALIVAEVASKSDARGLGASDEVYNRSLHLWEALTLGLHDLLAKQGKSDVALVLEDSLASMLLAVLASDALGPRHVHAVAGWSQEAGTTSLARRLAQTLKIDVVVGPTIDTDDDLMRRDVLEAALAALVRSTGAVGLSAEDKTYLAVEARADRCKACSLLPFGDVYRSDLIELAHMRNTISPVLAREAHTCYEAPRIQGLDAVEHAKEAQLRRVDVTLAAHIEWERSLTDCVARHGEERVSEEILHRLHESGAERATWPPYLIMSSRTLFDARTPWGFAWEDRIRAQEERLRGEDLLRRVTGEPSLSAEVDGGSEELSAFLEDLANGAESGPAREILGLLRDMLQNGTMSEQRAPFGPTTWGSPFSEN